MKCARCERRRKHYARRLCSTCYDVVQRAGQLAEWPSARWPARTRPYVEQMHAGRRDELLEEVPFLLSTGASYSEVAQRLGLKLPSLARRFADYRRAGLTTIRIPYREAPRD